MNLFEKVAFVVTLFTAVAVLVLLWIGVTQTRRTRRIDARVEAVQTTVCEMEVRLSRTEVRCGDFDAHRSAVESRLALLPAVSDR